jgi:glycosyltransferase 2 family protein
MNRQQLSGIIRLLLSVILLVLLFSSIDRQDLLTHFRELKPAYYLIGLVAYTGFVLLWTVRWYIIIRATNETVSFGRALSTLLMGIFFSMFLPTIVGTDVGRMVEMSREGDNSARVISSVLLDRLIGLIALVVVALVALAIGGAQYIEDQIVGLLIVGILVALIVGWLLFFNKAFMHLFDWTLRLPIIKRFAPNFRELYQTLYHLHNQPRLLISTLVVSLIMEVLEILSVIAAGKAIGVEIEPLYFFIFMPIIWVIVIIPITIGGLGLREGAFAFFFSQVGMTSAHATGMSLIYYSYSLVIGILGGVIFLSRSLNDSWWQKTNPQPPATITPDDTLSN